MLSVNLGFIALQMSHVVLLAAVLAALGAGHLAGRRQQVMVGPAGKLQARFDPAGVGNVFIDMLWIALLAARAAFIVRWFDLYRDTPWAMLDIRDGGFAPWAGLAAAALVALLHGWRHARSRLPLAVGLVAGALVWAALSLFFNNQGSAVALPDVALTPLATRVDDASSTVTATDPTAASTAELTADLSTTPAVTTPAVATTTLAMLANGQLMVVNLWATWCPPCRREMPVLEAAQQRETDIIFVFANQGESGTRAAGYLGDSGLTLANVVLDVPAELGRAVGSTALPTTLFYAANGKLIDTHLGELSAASLAAKLDRLRATGSDR
jgi:thiol-disulfide isomerase/thioredoxin